MSRPTYNSLYYQLRRANKLDELMNFLEDPSVPNPGSYSRCAKAESLLAGWGFTHSPSSIWRLYRRHILTWRMGIAQSSAEYIEDPKKMDEDIRDMTAQRTFEFLMQPNLHPDALVHLARIKHQMDVLRFNEKKFQATLQTKLETAITALYEEIRNCPEAVVAWTAMQKALKI
jgi:hypothetical protein